jgi:ABC-2 type transport system permease protein
VTKTAIHHRAFSFSRIGAIASNTLLELIRQKVFYFMIVFAFLGIGASFLSSAFSFSDQFQVVRDVSLGAMSVFLWLLATLATALILPKDIEDRTLYTILAKPVPRIEYLLGKLFGVTQLLFLALTLMSVVFVVVLYARQQTAIADAIRDYGSGPELQAQIAAIRAGAFQMSLVTAVLIIFTKALVCAALTMMLSTFATSWIFTVMVSVAVFIAGHLQPLARQMWLAGSAGSSTLAKGFFGAVAVLIPDFQIFNVVDEIVVGNPVPAAMITQAFAFGFGYVFIFTLVGYVLFSFREL